MTLPASVEEWREIRLITLDEADNYKSNQIYRIQGRLASISEEPSFVHSRWDNSIVIRLMKEKGEHSRQYSVYFRNVSNPENALAEKEVKNALQQVKASQLECILGVNQMSRTPVNHRCVGYLRLPGFFEVLITDKGNSVMCRNLPDDYSSLKPWLEEMKRLILLSD